MNSAEQTTAFIDRIKNLKTFEVKRMLDGPLEFRGGRIPFDIRANHDCAWFKVIAITQQEAEEMVNQWLQGQE